MDLSRRKAVLLRGGPLWKGSEGGAKEVYVMIPPKPFQNGPPLDSTVIPMKLVQQTNPKGLHRLRFKLRGEGIVSCQKDESLKTLNAHD